MGLRPRETGLGGGLFRPHLQDSLSSLDPPTKASVQGVAFARWSAAEQADEADDPAAGTLV